MRFSKARTATLITAGAAVGLIAGFVGLHNANAGTPGVKPLADAYVSSVAPNRNYGSAGRIEAGSGRLSYLSFSVSGVPADTKPQVTLTLHRDLHHLPSTTVSISAVGNSQWSETNITYENRPAVGSVIATQSVDRNMSTVSFDVSKYITGNGIYSVALTSPVTNDVARFDDRTDDDGPLLSVAIPNAVAPTTPSTTVKPTPTPASTTTTTAPAVSNKQILIGADANTPTQYDLSLFNQFNAVAGPLKVRRSFNTSLPATFQKSAAASDATEGLSSVVSWKPPNGDYAGLTAGKYDAEVTAWAKSIPSSAHVYATAYHEPENDMTGAQFVALQRHLYPLVKAANPNIQWGQIYMAYWWDKGTSHYAGPMSNWYPGDAYSDFVAVDAYTRTPATLANEPDFMDWYTEFSVINKPMFITEYGRYGTAPGQKTAAMEQVEAQVIAADAKWVKQSKISMWIVWDGSDGKLDWRLTDPTTQGAWRAVAQANS